MDQLTVAGPFLCEIFQINISQTFQKHIFKIPKL